MADGVELVTAYISIVPEGSKIAPEVRKQFGQVSKDADRAGRESGKRFARSFGSVAKTAGAFALGGGLVSFLKASNDEAREAQKVGAQTNAVIKSTGKAAHVSAKQFGDLATAISLKTRIDDEQIQAGENMLATFTNIRNSQGKNNKIFTQATKISTDLAVATKTDQVAANVLLGKSLNDPVKGLGRLTKIGVTFTDQQKAQVAAMVKQNNTAGAQKVILKELAKEFGGSAAAQATAGDKLNVAWKNLEETVGTAALPLLDKAATKITKDVIPSFSEFVTGIQDGTGKGGEFASTIKSDVLPVVKNLGGEAKTLYTGLHPILELLNDLPTPVKTAGISIGVLSSQFARFGPQLPATATGFERLRAGIRNVAGAGGLLALADAANRTNPAMAGLEGAAGGAATAFALTGNPIAALVGGVGGGLLGVFNAGNKAADALERADKEAAQASKAALAARPNYEDLKTTFHGLAAEITSATKAQIAFDIENLKNSKTGKTAADSAKALNINEKQLVNAAQNPGPSGARTAVGLGLKQARAEQEGDLAEIKRMKAEIDKIESQTGLERIKNKDQDDARLKFDRSVIPQMQKVVDKRKLDIQTIEDAIGAVGEQQKAEQHALALTSKNLATRKALRKEGDKGAIEFLNTHTLEANVGSVEAMLSNVKKLKASTVQTIINDSHLPKTTANVRAILTYVNDLRNARKIGLTLDGGVYAQIKAIQKAADHLDGKTIKIKVTASTNANLAELAALQGKATGGSVSRNTPYIVGERGPEIFKPNTAGRIITNSAARNMARTAGHSRGSSAREIADAVRSAISGGVTVSIDGMPFEAYMSAVAQDEIARA